MSLSGPAIRDSNPEPALKKWLEAPFLKKMAEGGAFTGSLTSSLEFVAVALERPRSTVLPSSNVLSGVPSRVPSRAVHKNKCYLPGKGHRENSPPLASGS